MLMNIVSRLLLLFSLLPADLDEQQHYAVVFDAGSTGSRVHVFSFDKSLSLLPIGSDYEFFLSTTPGLSSYEENPRAGAESLKPLLQQAEAVVPQTLRPTTPLKLGATAGLRQLQANASEAILAAVRVYFENESSLLYKAEWVTILDGTDEGAYQWMWIQNEWMTKCFDHRGQIHLHGGNYTWWKPKPTDMLWITGNDCGGSYWHGAKFLIMPLFSDGNWVTVRICLASMIIELHDPTLPPKPSDSQKFEREVYMRPLTCFLGQYLRFGNYWNENSHKIPDPDTDRFTLKLMSPKSRHMGIDEFSSPVHACMTVERLISGRPTVEWGNDPGNVRFYRFFIAARAFELCYST